MYNQEQKSRYLITIGGEPQRKLASKVFEITEAFEERAGADICTFEAEQLKPIVDKFVSLSAGANSTRMKIIKSYLSWCVMTGVPGAKNEISGVVAPIYNETRKKMVSGPAHLQKVLDAYFDAEDELTIGNVYRCYLWLIYCGTSPKDVTKIKIDDINLEERFFLSNGRKLLIYREAYQSFKNCVELGTFAYTNPAYVTQKTISRERVPGDILVRGIKAVPTEAAITHMLVVRGKELEGSGIPKITQKSVYNSGLFYRQYEEERAYAGIEGMETTWRHFYAELLIRNEGKEMREDTLRHEAIILYNNYVKWKLVYDC